MTHPSPLRFERARMIAAKVAGHVQTIAPPGLGHWPPAWEMVATPSRSFLDALQAWELYDGSDPDREAWLRGEVTAAANEVARAWTRAAEAWRQAGEPCPVSPVAATEAAHA